MYCLFCETLIGQSLIGEIGAHSSSIPQIVACKRATSSDNNGFVFFIYYDLLKHLDTAIKILKDIYISFWAEGYF